MDVAKALSSALAPVFLISGVAGLLASMNVRFGRVIDRTRFVLAEARRGHLESKDVDVELRVLYRRARALRTTIILGVTSIFSLAVTVFLIFSMSMLEFDLPYVIPLIFAVGLVFLLLSLALFIQDFAISLVALKREMRVAIGRDVISHLEE